MRMIVILVAAAASASAAAQPAAPSPTPVTQGGDMPDLSVAVPLPSLGPGGLASEPGPVPMTRVPPDYPQSALRRGVTGSVDLEFTVTTTGSVKDIIVVRGDPPGIFDDAAVRAVSQWTYAPQASERAGVVTTIRFGMGAGNPQSSRGLPSSRAIPQAFARTEELCPESRARGERSREERAFCEDLDELVSPAMFRSLLQVRPTSLGEGIWFAVIVPMAAEDSDNQDVQARTLRARLDFDEADTEALVARSRTAVAAEREAWARIESVELCTAPEVFATGSELGVAMNGINELRIRERRRLVTELLAAVDAPLREAIVNHVVANGAVSPVVDFRSIFSAWTNADLASARAVLCP